MRIGFVTLGCDKNTVDSEYLAGILAQRGHSVEPVGEGRIDWDAVVVTTCGFIEAARGQSLQEIAFWARAKREHGRPARLIVAGCLSQVDAEKILGSFPEIDGLAGVGDFDTVADLIEQADPQSAEVSLALRAEPSVDVRGPIPRRRLDNTPHVYLKIADGCDHACSFCSIPRMKGRNCSVPPETLEAEARELIRGGARELILIGQDLSQYGRDLGAGAPDLTGLIRRLAAIEGDFWIRMLYLYPTGVTDSLLELIGAESKICRYLDIPLQHLDPGVLKAMKRPGGDIRGPELFARIRAAIPDIVLRTTFIVGFPGETEDAFDALLGEVQRLRIDRLGAFVFSPEEGTDAIAMPDQVPPDVASDRLDRLMRAQAEIASALNEGRVGQRQRVLFEGFDSERNAAIARSQSEAPDIDGVIFVEGADAEAIGEFGDVAIVRAEGYDLAAENI